MRHTVPQSASPSVLSWLFIALLLTTQACTHQGTLPACGTPSEPISAIQGAGPTSPMVGASVEVEGVVAASFVGNDALGGLFLQTHEDTETGEPSASRGLFVATTATDAEVGDRVRVTGVVTEIEGMTALTEVSTVARCGAANVTSRLLLAGEEDDLERFEGMLIHVDGPLAVADTYALGRNGRWQFARGARPYTPTNSTADQAGSQVVHAEPSRLAVDDGSRAEPAPGVLLLPDGRPPRVGDEVSSLVGVVVEDEAGYALHPTEAIAVTPVNLRQDTPPVVSGSLRVAAFNVLNFFTTLGQRGARDAEELDRQERKIVTAIRALDAEVIALIEVENGGPALGRLVTSLNEGAERSYAIAGDALKKVGEDDIRVALIYRDDRVKTVGAMQVLGDPVYRDRPPVAQTFQAGTDADPGVGTFSVIAAHFKSKGGCRDATGPDRDQRDGQGCWNDLRVREARRMLDLVEGIQRSSGDDDVLVVGDLNAYGAEDPIVALREGGLIDLTERFIEPDERYSFVYRGRAGSLDYAFATPALAARATGAAYWHINADESRAVDYRVENLADLYRPDPFRSSDHDPVIVGFD